MKTTVVNKAYNHFTVNIGRPSPLGNPYVIGIAGNRKEVITKHKVLFLNSERLKKLARETCQGEILGCYCKPKACHGDTIAEYLNRLEMTDEAQR